jgi:uncharacterized hydrophobic protein (TIGR00271 family)
MADKTLLSSGPNSAAKISQFWVLLALAGVIATAGVVNDSTATVIGAMIVAPLMTPILGSAYALVLADRHRALRSLLTVLGGAALVILIGFGFGLIDPLNMITEGNSQVDSRVAPRLLDLIAALATGLVGAFALVRSDVSDTLPGVAIAISLVPPLAVVGLTLEEDRADEALGAFLLFSTNVTAIIFTATIVLLLYRVRATATEAGYPVGKLKGGSLAVVVGAVLVVAVPLAYGSQKIARDNFARASLLPVAQDWADANGWQVIELVVDSGKVRVTALGPPPRISAEVLRASLDEEGFTDVDLTVELVVGGAQEYPGQGQ